VSLVFADPPYGPTAQRLLDDARLARVLMPDGLLVLESAKRDALAPGEAWSVKREAIYGDTRVSFFARVTVDE
jgi:16S rRNA G966 N2-methylase RsmD